MNKQKVEKEEVGLKTRELHRPPRWLVILHNDDVTTMDFVVSILVDIFGKTEQKAEELMMKVHLEGRAVAGVYSKDIAETKIYEAETAARQKGFPLLLTLEEDTDRSNAF